MRYKQRTKRLGIPVPGYDDRILPEMELKKYAIIEGMLLAGLRGAVNSVFAEGDMSVRRKEDGKYGVVMSAIGSKPCCTGTVGGAYFEAPSSVSWDGLDDGTTYFLYLRGSAKTFEDPSEVRPIASPRRLLDGVSVLVAKVDLRGDKPALERDPDGKVNARDLSAHVAASENPHGETVSQDGLAVRKRLALDPEAVLEIGPASVPARALAEAMSRRSLRTSRFVTGGPAGKVVEVDGKVAFAAVSRESGGEMGAASAGEVAVGYFGSDEAVRKPEQFVVRNSGEAGVAMRALVVLE
jgi:hypothetical protein